MIYVKSVLAGFAALLAVLLLGVVGLVGWQLWMNDHLSREGGVGAVAYDISSPWIGLPLLIIAGLIFVAGFYWEFRWATRRRTSR